MALKSLFNILDKQAVKSNLLKGALKALTVEEADSVLQKIFGEEIKQFAHAAFIKDRILSIACRGSAAAQEIKMRQDEIIKTINQNTGETSVERIKIIL